MFDVIIVGAGAAGCSAAVTARMRNLDVMVVFSGDGAMRKAHWVDNYPGLPHIEGHELVTKMRAHVETMGVKMLYGLVQKILPMGRSFSVLVDNDIYESRSILLACGTSRVKTLGGEEALLGQGVSYCATCDGMFYKGKEIIVVGAGAEAIEEANYLAEIARVTYFSESRHDLAGLDAAITVVSEKPKAIKRENTGMILETDKGTHTADGVFVFRPSVAMTQLLPEVAVEGGSVKVDKIMATNISGVFAAGDMTGQPLQAAKAVGEGNVAALSIASYVKGLKDGAK
jgi:thioredoxin reductase (NADPH)